MPHQVYSLLTTHRSHRIAVPELADSVGTGKPHACNLCHLDKSLGWTQRELARWPGGRKARTVRLDSEEEAISAVLLLLARGDARSRAIVAGAFAHPAAQQASGTDWFGPFLTWFLDHERYPVVRHLLHRGLRTAHGEGAVGPYDALAAPAARAALTHALRRRFATPVREGRPGLPLTLAGRPDEAALQRLLEKRHDPDVTINE